MVQEKTSRHITCDYESLRISSDSQKLIQVKYPNIPKEVIDLHHRNRTIGIRWEGCGRQKFKPNDAEEEEEEEGKRRNTLGGDVFFRYFF